MSIRADKNTITQKKIRIYSDFLDNFDQNPHTGYLGVVTNEDSIAQSYRNLIQTNHGERFYDSSKAGDVRSKLFELFSDTSVGFAETLKIELTSKLQIYEPRGQIIDIQVIPNENNNAFVLKLIYSTTNNQDQIHNLDLHFQRVR